MGVLIDSGVFIAAERQGLPPDAAIARLNVEGPALASITASELLAGVHRANTLERRMRREAFVEAVLGKLPIIPFDLRAARTYARIWAHLASTGQPIGTHDLLIAATALTQDCAVVTYNARDFQRVPGLTVRQLTW